MAEEPRSSSFEELYRRRRALPEGARGEILEPGTLHVGRSPSKRQRLTAENIRSQLGPSLIETDRPAGGWWFATEPELRLGERLFAPQLAGWRAVTHASVPEERPIAARPDWVCELLTPSTAVTDIRTKLPAYARSGVPYVWIVDAERQLVQVFQPERDRPVLVATASEEETILLPPFDVAICPRRWWIEW